MLVLTRLSLGLLLSALPSRRLGFAGFGGLRGLGCSFLSFLLLGWGQLTQCLLHKSPREKERERKRIRAISVKISKNSNK